MATLLTQQELRMHLNDFYDLLKDFDYSKINNITFLNLDAVLAYMENVEDNPFKNHYAALQKKLDYLQPYLPFVSSIRANEFLECLSKTNVEIEISNIKQKYTNILRDDFIKFCRTVTTKDSWNNVLSTCEQIRLRKENMLLALH